jgi:hypothetical protein
MKVWWVLSVTLVTLMVAGLALAWSLPFVLQAVSVVFVALWAIGLIYFVVRRW